MIRKLSAIIIIFVMIVTLSITGCSKENDIPDIELPPTSILTAQGSWGVVTSTHLRLREGPSLDNGAITTLWRGSVVEIFTRTDTPEVIENEEDYWYQVNYGGLTGWVFGAYLDRFNSREGADKLSREIK